jgi:hypothetical protein
MVDPNGDCKKVRYVNLISINLKEEDEISGSRAIFIDENYSESICMIERINREIETIENLFKLYDVIISRENKREEAICIYFASFIKVCIKKGFRYERFSFDLEKMVK